MVAAGRYVGIVDRGRIPDERDESDRSMDMAEPIAR
jgi:hypothetical protein